MKNIFVAGLEPFNLALLKSIPTDEPYAFHKLLDYHEAVMPADGRIDFEALLALAEERLAAFDGTVDGIIGYWDFPSSALVPVLCKQYDLPRARLEAVAACEHKYWARTEQQKSIPDYVPRFCAVDPFADDPLAQVDLPFPFWLKPIKAHSSYLGFKIQNRADFEACLPIVRANIAHFGEAFNAFLEHVDVPDDIALVDGCHCIAEEIISEGEQCTLEGYVYGGEVVVYGVVDSVRTGRHQSCFSRYQYPSRLPAPVQECMIDAARQFMSHIGYDSAPFNVEFYWNPTTDQVRLLEVNTRLSKSHSPLFKMVDGVTHQKIGIDLVLGREPDLPHRQGRYGLAAKFMERVFDDGIVARIPGKADIERFHQAFPDGMTRILVDEGDRLAHLMFQDSYSFEIAEVFLGADSEAELLEKHDAALKLLPFDFEPLEPRAA
jgi:biotin carboxylase